MTEQGKKFWTWCYMTAAVIVILAHVFLAGCVDVGSSSGGVEADTASTSASDQTQAQE
jgi:hypothetical protein